MSENVDKLKNLIAETLEHRGVLSKIRAELRQHVFLALDEQESNAIQANHANSPTTKSHVTGKKKKLSELHANPLGDDLLELVKDMLEFYDLEYTNALFNTEAEASGHRVNRKVLADKYSLTPAIIPTQPLLLEILQRQLGMEQPQPIAPIQSAMNGARDSETKPTKRGLDSSSSVISPRDRDEPASGVRSTRSLYRERLDENHDGDRERERERMREREREGDERKTKQLESEKLSPRIPAPATLAPLNTLASAPAGLAPLAPLKKPLGGLGTLAPLGKSSLASLPPPSSLSSLQRNLSPTNSNSPPTMEKKLTPPPTNTSPTNATSPTTASSASSFTFNSSIHTSSSNSQPQRSSAPSSSYSTTTTSAPAVTDELDLDALESELGISPANKSSSSGGTFLPGGNDEEVEIDLNEPTTRAAAAPASTTKQQPSNTSFQHKPSSLSSLAAAPSFKSSSLGALAPIGKSRPTFTAPPEPISREEEYEDDTEPIQADDQTSSHSHGNQTRTNAPVDREVEDEDVSEELEIEAEQSYEDEEEF